MIFKIKVNSKCLCNLINFGEFMHSDMRIIIMGSLVIDSFKFLLLKINEDVIILFQKFGINAIVDIERSNI